MILGSELALTHAPGAQPAPPPSHPAPRFTIDGSDRLEHELERIRSEVRSGVLRALPPGKVAAILLGGGYGRGEGGVLHTPTGDRLYNDLDFYVALHGPRRLNELFHAAALHTLAHTLALVAHVEVEFKIVSLAELRTAPVTMFSYDLVMGHRWIYGDDRLLAGCERHRKAEHIPPAEAARLLLNRCTGLLFARERLARVPFTTDDADFAARNIAKARLALGDAFLAATGRYHWSCRERHRRLRDLLRLENAPPWLPAIVEQHQAGVAFKLRPLVSEAPRRQLARELAEVSPLACDVWLWLESRRLDRSFPSPRDYSLSGVDKCPGGSRWRNFLAHLRTFGLRGLLARHAPRYPSVRLFDALPLLLQEPAALAAPTVLRALQRTLVTPARTLPRLVAAYTALWERFR